MHASKKVEKACVTSPLPRLNFNLKSTWYKGWIKTWPECSPRPGCESRLIWWMLELDCYHCCMPLHKVWNGPRAKKRENAAHKKQNKSSSFSLSQTLWWKTQRWLEKSKHFVIKIMKYCCSLKLSLGKFSI